MFYKKGTQEVQSLHYCVAIAVLSSSVLILYYIVNEFVSGREHLLFLH